MVISSGVTVKALGIGHWASGEVVSFDSSTIMAGISLASLIRVRAGSSCELRVVRGFP